MLTSFMVVAGWREFESFPNRQNHLIGVCVCIVWLNPIPEMLTWVPPETGPESGYSEYKVTLTKQWLISINQYTTN